jgi:hypothetical protein
MYNNDKAFFYRKKQIIFTRVNHVVFHPTGESIVVKRLMFNLNVLSSPKKVNSSWSVVESSEVPDSGNPYFKKNK